MNSELKKMYNDNLLKFLNTNGNSNASPSTPCFPKISIITASYNQKKFLERTINSVINQGYPNVEHIVIDGGSTDGSVAILEKYDKYLSYWVSELDNGQTNAINKGLKKATGELIGFQNSDDIYLPGAFFKVAKSARENPEAGIIYGDFLHIDEFDQVLDEQLLGTASLWIQVMLGPQIHNQAAFWRKMVSDSVGQLDESYAFDMDYEFFSRVLAAQYKAVHVRDFLGAFRHHGASKTSNLAEVSRRELKKVADIYRGKLGLLGFMPRSLGRRAAQLVKVAKHISDGRVDYLFRDRLRFKD